MIGRLASDAAGMNFGRDVIAIVIILPVLACVATTSSPALAQALSAQASVATQSASTPDFWHRDRLSGEWMGLRNRLANEGISIGLSLALDGFDNFLGGKKSGQTGASTVDVSADINTKELFGLNGGNFHIDLENHAGGNPSRTLVGDLQVFDRLSFRSYLQIFELWYQQKFFGGKLSIKIGKADANRDFAVVSNGQMFLNSSAQLAPTLFVLPTTPAPMAGISVFYRPNPILYVNLGIYNANRGDDYLIFVGNPQDYQPTSGGVLAIGESGLTWSHLLRLGYEGDFRLGVWGHTGKFSKLNGGFRYGAEGFYSILDQTLWKPPAARDSQRGVRAFVEYGHTERSVAAIYQHLGGGISWTGPFPSRPDDIIGFDPQCAFLSPDADFPHSYELALEAFYRANLTGWLNFEPDLQYIVNPGGRYANALVATLRAEVVF